jgi:hypothetical protein
MRLFVNSTSSISLKSNPYPEAGERFSENSFPSTITLREYMRLAPATLSRKMLSRRTRPCAYMECRP